MPERFCSYLADTPYAQVLHHHLRYKVYCERKHYERGMLLERLPQERDDYDALSARFILRDRLLGRWIGAARLVPNTDQLMPAQLLGAVDNRHNRLLMNDTCAEVSRLATTLSYPLIETRTEMLRTVILSTLGESLRLGVEWLIFLISPGLARMLVHLGVPMESCGNEIEHRGTRRAYLSHVERGINQVAWAQCLRNGTLGYERYSLLQAASSRAVAAA